MKIMSISCIKTVGSLMKGLPGVFSGFDQAFSAGRTLNMNLLISVTTDVELISSSTRPPYQVRQRQRPTYWIFVRLLLTHKYSKMNRLLVSSTRSKYSIRYIPYRAVRSQTLFIHLCCQKRVDDMDNMIPWYAHLFLPAFPRPRHKFHGYSPI